MQWNQNIAPFKNTAAYIIISTKNKIIPNSLNSYKFTIKTKEIGPHGRLPVRGLELYVLVKTECQFSPLVIL